MQYTTHIERKNGDEILKEEFKSDKSGSNKKLEDTISFDQIEEAKMPINRFYDSKILDQTGGKINKMQENNYEPEEPPNKDLFYAQPVMEEPKFIKEKKQFDLPPVKDKNKESPFEKKNRDFLDQLKVIDNTKEIKEKVEINQMQNSKNVSISNAYEEIQKEFSKKLEKLENKFKLEQDKYSSNLPDPIPIKKKELNPIINLPKIKYKEPPKSVLLNNESKTKPQENIKEMPKEVVEKEKKVEPLKSQAIIQPQIQLKSKPKSKNKFGWEDDSLEGSLKIIEDKNFDIKPFNKVDDSQDSDIFKQSRKPEPKAKPKKSDSNINDIMDDDIWNEFDDIDDLTQQVDYYHKLEPKPMSEYYNAGKQFNLPPVKNNKKPAKNDYDDW